jgi:pyruvate ferredoxin oxidoreductase alpha subunit
MLARDSGAIQIFVENAQEAYDYLIIAQKLAEHQSVLLPAMVMLDGFTISHTADVAELLDDKVVKEFVGKYKPKYPLLDVDHPTTQGSFSLPNYYFEFKRQQVEAMENALRVFREVQDEFSLISGRRYNGFFEGYHLDDADYVVVVLGSTAGTATEAVDELRKRREKVGLLKLWLFRPFPREEIAKALAGKKAIAILDRSLSLGSFGPLFLEISSRLKGPRLYNYIYGLGGRDITSAQIRDVFLQIKDEGLSTKMHYIGLRE